MMRQIEIPYIGKFIGAYINVLYLTMPLLGILSYAVSTLTFYSVNRDWISIHTPWLSMPIFILLLIATCHIIMILNFCVLYKSYYNFLNKQVYKHGNPVQEDLTAIREKLGIARKKDGKNT